MSTVYKTESFQLTSPDVGDTFHIDVSLPDVYEVAVKQDWPVAYVLDGNLAFHLAATTNALCGRDLLDPQMKPAIVVGIGYPNPSDLSLLRVRDFTPQGSVDDWFADVYLPLTGKRAESGGADAFLAFIQQQLHPEICSRYRVRGDTAAIFGDSYGGLFTLYALLQQASLFDRYWIGSPGVFGAALPLLDRLAPRLDAGFEHNTRIAVTLGAEERHRSVQGLLQEEIYQHIASSYDRIVATLQAVERTNLSVAAKEFASETHTSVFPASFTYAWRFLMHPDSAGLQ